MQYTTQTSIKPQNQRIKQIKLSTRIQSKQATKTKPTKHNQQQTNSNKLSKLTKINKTKLFQSKNHKTKQITIANNPTNQGENKSKQNPQNNINCNIPTTNQKHKSITHPTTNKSK